MSPRRRANENTGIPHIIGGISCAWRTGRIAKPEQEIGVAKCSDNLRDSSGIGRACFTRHFSNFQIRIGGENICKQEAQNEP
jgi:hypothetical protein